jgi:hypothetical protein
MKMSLSNRMFYFLICIGLGLIMFKDSSGMFSDDTNIRTFIGRMCFIVLQSMVYTAGMATIWIMVKNSISKKVIIGLFFLNFMLVSFRTIYQIHDFLLNYGLYISLVSGDNPFFLHALILVAGVALVFSLGYFLIFKKTVLKIFTIFLCISFFSFFYFAHYYLGRQAYKDFLNQSRLQISFILNNMDNSEKLCKELKYQCFIVDNEVIPNLKFDNKNRMNPVIDSTIEGIEIFKSSRADFLQSGETEKIFVTDNFARKNVRAVNYAFKKTTDGKLFVVMASDLFAYGLDLYLFYITVVNIIFLTVWMGLLFILYYIHRNKPVIRKLNLLDDSA